MNIQYIGKNIEITDPLRKRADEKFQHLSERFTHLHSLHVTFHVEHMSQVAEVTAHIDNVELHAKAESDDLYHSIDLAYDKILSQLTKHKEKLTDQHR